MSLTERMMEDNRILLALNDISKTLEKDEVKMLLKLLEEYKGRELDLLIDLTNYTYREKPVDVRTFIEDPYYLGLKGEIYPVIVDDLCELFSGKYDEAVLTGGIGLVI